ncbi:17288_t:CDS:2, partial [Dentiscutata erythropus]
ISLAFANVRGFSPDGAVVSSQPQSVSSPLTLNNNLYIFNTQNYTWVNTFDASNIYGNSTNLNDSISYGERIGVGITVLVIVIIIVVGGGYIYYKKFCNRKISRSTSMSNI